MTVYGRDVSTKAEAGCVGCSWTSEGKPDACRAAARKHVDRSTHITFTRTTKTRLFKRADPFTPEVARVERGTV